MDCDRRKTAQMVELSMERRKIKPYMIEMVVRNIMEGNHLGNDHLLDELVEKIKKKYKPSTESNLSLVKKYQAYWTEWLDGQGFKPVKTPVKKKLVNKPKKRKRSIIKKGPKK